MSPALAHAAAKRDLMSQYKPVSWTASSLFTPATIRTEVEVAGAEAELQAFDRHALETANPVPEG